ncbi:MAG TPA: 3-hydroxyacyl-CoA dehydrogenase NAD-binding domain-containing protein [Eoetvoesiella sp.]
MSKTNKNITAAPTIFPEDVAYWEAANRNELLIKHCSSCDRSHFYPRPHCPFCGNASTEWKKSLGTGRIYSYSIARNAPRPTAPALVTLNEGPTILTSIVDADVFNLNIDDEVEVRFDKTDGDQLIPLFTTRSANLARSYSQNAMHLLDAESYAANSQAGLNSVAVIGAGIMGIGIVIALLSADLSVYLTDQSDAALERAQQRIFESLDQSVEKGRMSAEDCERRKAQLTLGTSISDISQADLIIEAVYENLELKQSIFRDIDQHAKPGAILGTNTSTLDINKIASATARPEMVVGLHFFSPANVMKLLEIVRGDKTCDQALAISKLLGQRLGKVSVVVGVCFGFVGNRLMLARERQAGRLLLEGSSPEQVDRVLKEFGLPMGTYELQDLTSGIELSFRRRQASGEKNWLGDRLVELGRVGLKAGKGYYKYAAGKRKPIPDPEVIDLIKEASALEGITRRSISDAEVKDQLIYVMINEGIKLVEEGIVSRASDIDLVWQYGYGWPSWKGGPMYYADSLGLSTVYQRMQQFHELHGDAYKPANLLSELARTGATLTTSASAGLEHSV